MPYYLIGDFRAGLDARRVSESATAGSVRQLMGGFVNSGGEIEKLQGFIEDTAMSAALAEASNDGGWAGPIRTADGEFCFVGVGTQPSSMPSSVGGVNVFWSQLTGAPLGLEGLTGFDVFGDQLYLSCQFGSGVKHYYGAPGQAMTEVLDDTDSLIEPHVRTIASKVWRAKGSVLRYSDVNDPTRVTAADGGGFIDVTTAEGAIGPIKGLGVYRNQLAVFGQAGVQIWQVDPDPSPSKTFLSEVVGGLNVIAGKSIATYDNGDVLFLTPNGIRSLRTQNLSANAAADDVGTPIDDLVREAVLTGNVTLEGRAGLVGQDMGAYTAPPANAIMAVVEPITGQYWLIVGGIVFILSRFSRVGVQAWSTAQLPDALLGSNLGHARGAAVASDRMLICTEDDKAYLYGGAFGLDYDDSPVTVTTPFMAADEPATEKTFYAVDVLARGRWTVEAAFDPGQPELFDHIATIEGTTTRLHQLPLRGRSTHLALRLTSTDKSTVAKLSQLAVHFAPGRKA